MKNMPRAKHAESDPPTKYALVSVSDKRGIAEFAKTITAAGYGIISTGGTARELEKHGIAVTPVSAISGNPECFDGRMKTISFRIEGGLLYDRRNARHVAEAQANGIPDISIVVCNLYPFGRTIQLPGVTLEEAVENIDVGGPTMIRSGAKNFESVLVVTDPADYKKAGDVLLARTVSSGLRLEFAAKAFRMLSEYDRVIANYLDET